MIIIEGIVSFLILWVMFIQSAWMKKNVDRIPKYIKPFAYLFVGLFLIGDVIWNLIFGTMLFLQLPDDMRDWDNFSDWTLTHRMRRIIRGDTNIERKSWRWWVAVFICRYCAEPWDKNHCSLNLYLND